MAKIAYYCRFAAVDQGIRLIGSATPVQQQAANSFLEQLLNRVESDKAALGIKAEDESSDLSAVRNFALRVFKTADDADRSGLGNADTARSFVAVGNLLDVVRNLSGAAAEAKLGEISKYAKGRSVEILKAVKEGRTAPPPADNGAFFDVDAELAALGGAPATSFASAAAAAAPVAPEAPQYTPQYVPQPQYGAPPAGLPAPAPQAQPTQGAYGAPSPHGSGGGPGAYGGAPSASSYGGDMQVEYAPAATPVPLAPAQSPTGSGYEKLGGHAFAPTPVQQSFTTPTYGGAAAAPAQQSFGGPVPGAGVATTAPTGYHSAVGAAAPASSFAPSSSSSSSTSSRPGRGSGIPAAIMQDAMGEWRRTGVQRYVSGAARPALVVHATPPLTAYFPLWPFSFHCPQSSPGTAWQP